MCITKMHTSISQMVHRSQLRGEEKMYLGPLILQKFIQIKNYFSDVSIPIATEQQFQIFKKDVHFLLDTICYIFLFQLTGR